MKITEGIFYVGVKDAQIDLFEGQFSVPQGMTYNSYLIMDEKIAVLDTVDKAFGDQWLLNIQEQLNGKTPDYLIVHHMEPDHSANIEGFMNKYPQTKIVASQKAFSMMANFFGNDYKDNQIVVTEGFKLSLGNHQLSFVTAPMVHWPEVIISYDSFTKTLFSADSFGKFGAVLDNKDWDKEARRYYFGIVGKYGVQVQALLKKLALFDLENICPLHGPILTQDIPYYINLYNTWSSYTPETEGVFIAYTSVYGHTKQAVLSLANLLKQKGCGEVVVADLARTDMAENIAQAFKYSKIVFATTTYNADVFPFMKTFIEGLLERNFSFKKVGFIENGTWVPLATKTMQKMLEGCKNINYCSNNVRILSAINQKNQDEIEALAEELCL